MKIAYASSQAIYSSIIDTSRQLGRLLPEKAAFHAQLVWL